MALSLHVGHPGKGCDLGQSVSLQLRSCLRAAGTTGPLLFSEVSVQLITASTMTGCMRCSFAACDNDVVILENTQMFLKTCNGGVK